ncbi:AMP-binding protein, partial [Legionella oakridgensis]|uniref:AMP-binding protein n=1 Tax=Legionella oakridgensis TaxID=29423 RepID=UPI0005659F24
GVMVEHKSVVNYVFNVMPYLEGMQHIDFSTSIAFDLTVTCVFASLLTGKKLAIYAGDVTDVASYIEHIRHYQIDFVKLTPRYLAQMAGLDPALWIKRCLIGGEKVTESELVKMSEVVGEIYDEYGPTEATVGATIALKDRASIDLMGNVYSNYQAYVLDNHLNPLPIGA